MGDISKIREVVSIRLDPEEQNLLEKLSKREGLNKSQYMRFLLKNQERVFTFNPEEKQELKKQFYHLSLLGSNLNQITYHLNRESLVNDIAKISPEMKGELMSLYEQITDQISLLQIMISNLIKTQCD